MVALIAGTAITLAVSSAAAADWPQWRGPERSNVSAETGLLQEWPKDGPRLLWEAEGLGEGVASVAVASGRVYYPRRMSRGDKIFLTCYTGYGIDRNAPGEMEKLKRHLLYLNRADGKVLWQRDIVPVLPESAYGGYVAWHGYAVNGA